MKNGPLPRGRHVLRRSPEAAPSPGKNLRGVLAAAVREAIMRGEYPPGAPLGEVELAQRFGVSRGPVREALIQLEREYLVRSFPNRGSFVTTMAEHEFDEILMLRSVLEPIALDFARQRASPADLMRLRKLLRNLESVARRRDQRAYIGKDYEFHVAIWELSGQPLLTEVLKRISAPVFVFEAMLEERYRRADYDVMADARAHQTLLDYLEGKTRSDAGSCLKPLLELALRAEKPIVFSTPEWRR